MEVCAGPDPAGLAGRIRDARRAPLAGQAGPIMPRRRLASQPCTAASLRGQARQLLEPASVAIAGPNGPAGPAALTRQPPARAGQPPARAGRPCPSLGLALHACRRSGP